MNKLLFLLFCFPLFLFSQTPIWEWATGWAINNGLKDIAVSSYGESYVIGGFYGQQIIGNDTINSISTNLSCSPQCPQSYIAKLNVNGNLAWTYPVLSTDFTNPIEIKLAPNGYIYALFEYKDPVFSNGAFNFKIIKLDSTGNLISEYISPLTNGGLSAYSMCIDENNNITIPAHLNGGPVTIGSIDYHGPLIMMNLSENFSVNWVYTASSSTSPGVNGGLSSGLQITYSETLSQYIVTGQLNSQLIFGNIIIGSPNTSGTYFIFRVDYTGNLINASAINYYPQEIISHQGLVYTAGRTNLNGSSNIQILDIVLTCIDNSNQQIWEEIVGSSSYFDYATDITIDNNDNLYLTGAIHGNYLTSSSVFFDTIQTTVYGLQFVSSFDLNGNINWLEIQDTLTLGGAEFMGIETDNNGSLYLCGNSTTFWYDLNLDGNILTSFSNYPEISVVAKLGNYFLPATGCTDSTALNYDPLANTDDGSCITPFSNLPDSINACDSVLICVDSISVGSYSWNTSNTSTSGNLAIGDFYQGGVIFWIDPNDSTQGLACDVADVAFTDWGCTGSHIAGGTAIGAGLQNTIDIVSNCTQTGIAARYCHNMISANQTDWFLPSQDEAYQIYYYRNQINPTAIANGGSSFSNGEYWTSTESPQWNTANGYYLSMTVHFGNGIINDKNKGSNHYVRAVRSFSYQTPINTDTTNCVWVSNAGWNYITVTTANGITATDSVYVSLNTPVSGSSSVSACNTYTWEGQTITSSGNLTHTYQNTSGCDSVHTLSVTINNSTSNTTTTITDCDSYTWPVNGTAYTQSGTYININTNNIGCPDTNTLILTINNSTYTVTSITSCDNYTWPIDGNTYITSGTYTYVSTNTAGCTYIDSLVLTIGNSSSTTTTINACDSLYSWSVNGITYTLNGTYIDSSINLDGCLHTEILILTLNNSTTNTTTIVECDSYTWSVNGIVYISSGIYIYSSININGCIHVDTLDLTLDYTSIYNDNISICHGDIYSINNSIYSTSGSYIDSILDVNCWSIINTNLTVGDTLISSISQVGNILASNVIGGFPPYSYQWNTFDTTANITTSLNGQYWLIISDSLNCPVDTTYFYVDIHSGISDFGINELSIYPNPSDDVFNISFKSNNAQDFSVRILNVIGEKLIVEDLQQFIGEYSKKISLNQNSKGIYFLEIETKNGIINKKIILN
ncbi:T9SS type A sorting domain-containing protein [Flavobacteriales bacterium]|nr:T9SS type A sorting domain-containing protein [Flavobacteriales bacterium]MDA7596386.1 T9SS type A sorting domain-containing protein [Flavobacteriales bacterium]